MAAAAALSTTFDASASDPRLTSAATDNAFLKKDISGGVGFTATGLSAVGLSGLSGRPPLSHCFKISPELKKPFETVLLLILATLQI